MFLKVSMFALALCSVRAGDLPCSELLQPLEDQHPALRKFVIHAAGSSNAVITDMTTKADGSWVEISSAETQDTYHVTAADKWGDACIYSKGVVNVWSKGMNMTFESQHFNSKHEGVFLRTLDDNVDVWLHQDDYRLGSKHFKGKSITLLKRSKDVTVAGDTMERFRSQAKCEGLDVLEMTADLCDDQPTD